jgi:hypothetical protein
LERLGQTTGELIGFFRASPPVDNQGRPFLTEAEYLAARRQKGVRWATGATSLVALLYAARLLFSMRGRRGGVGGPTTNGAGPVGGGGGGLSRRMRMLFTIASFLLGFATGRHAYKVVKAEDEKEEAGLLDGLVSEEHAPPAAAPPFRSPTASFPSSSSSSSSRAPANLSASTGASMLPASFGSDADAAPVWSPSTPTTAPSSAIAATVTNAAGGLGSRRAGVGGGLTRGIHQQSRLLHLQEQTTTNLHQQQGTDSSRGPAAAGEGLSTPGGNDGRR